MKHMNDLLDLSVGEHSLEEVLFRSGMKSPELDQKLIEEGICPSCGSTKTHTEHDYFDYWHSEYLFICDTCGLTTGGW